MKRFILCLSLIAFLLLSIQIVQAANDAAFSLDWWTVDNGGTISQGGNYALIGTIGQADPGTLQGEKYSLVGGFWAIVQEAWKVLFLPFMSK